MRTARKKGSIQKKGKVYYAVVRFRGKPKWIRGGTLKDAQRVLNEAQKDVDDGIYKEIPKVTYNEFTEIWLNSYAGMNMKQSTLDYYESIINNKSLERFNGEKLTNITTAQLRQYIAERLKSVSNRTVINEVTVLKLMFKRAYRWGYLKVNPAELIDRPRAVKKEIDLLTPSEVSKLFEHADNQYRVAFMTDVMTGLRAGELWGLQWGDIDWNSKQLHIRRTLWKGKFQTPKTKNSIRRVDLPDMLVSELKKWKLACPVGKDDVVFPSPRGKHSDHFNVYTKFKATLRRAGLRHVSFHSLRHTNASMRIHAGQNIKYISMQLGHSSITITLDVYGHLFNDEQFNRKQADMLEASFQSVRKPLENSHQEEKIDAQHTTNPLLSLGNVLGI